MIVNSTFKFYIYINLFFLITVFVLYNAAGDYFNPLLHFLFLVIVLESIVLMTIIHSPVMKMYFTFSYLFFGCIPYLEHSQEIFSYWGFASIEDDILVIVSILILLLNIVVVITYMLSGNLSFRRIQKIFRSGELISLIKENNMQTKDNFFILLILSLCSVFFTLYSNNFNFLYMIYRTGLEEVASTTLNSNSTTLLYFYFVKPIPAVVLIYYLSLKPKNYKLKSIFFLILCLVGIFPTSVPRFYAAAIYIPIVILYFNSLLSKSRLSFFIIFSILFIFPFLNSFRRFSEDFKFSFFDGFDFLYQGHFDSYLSIGQVIKSDFVTYGQQIIGNLLFFIPRLWWPSKPLGTGFTLATEAGLPFTNISANYYAEGYANFGYLGMLLFAVLLGFSLRYIDENLIKNLVLKKGSSMSLPFYLVSLGFIFFILRGDLLSSISYFLGFSFCIKFCSLFFRRKPVG